MRKSINKNHAKRVYLSGFFCLSLFFYSSFSQSFEVKLDENTSVSLYSLAIHRESLNDIYIAAIFAPESIENHQQLFDSSLPKRMSFKFLSKYSTRQVSRLIKQRISLNNPKASWRPYTSHIVKIAGLFKRAIQSGDQLDFDYIPGKGTKVYLNKSLFLTIDPPEVYPLLLNIWLGNIQPTEAFKNAIRGDQTEEDKLALSEQYLSIEPIVGRFDQDKAKPKVVKAATKKRVVKPKKKVAVKKKPISKPDKKVSVDKTDVTKVAAPLASQADGLKLAADASKNVAIKSSENKALQNKDEAASDQENTKAVNNSNLVPVEIPVVIAKQAVDKDLLSGTYTQKLIGHIKKIQYYPKKALIAEVQGSLTVKIIINQQGEILSRKLTKRSGSRLLDREVLKMVGKASPFPSIPAELEVTSFEFSIPLNFTLSD